MSAGVLPFRRVEAGLEVLLVHPGGPFWARRDVGAWSIPKGEVEPGEVLVEAARRELEEETGWRIEGALLALGSIRQRSGKVVHAWAGGAAFDPSTLRSNTVTLRWPRASGQTITVPEVDRAAWLDLQAARVKINVGQVPFLDRLPGVLSGD